MVSGPVPAPSRSGDPYVRIIGHRRSIRSAGPHEANAHSRRRADRGSGFKDGMVFVRAVGWHRRSLPGSRLQSWPLWQFRMSFGESMAAAAIGQHCRR